MTTKSNTLTASLNNIFYNNDITLTVLAMIPLTN